MEGGVDELMDIEALMEQIDEAVGERDNVQGVGGLRSRHCPSCPSTTRA